MENQDKQKLKVTDRRHFTREGERRPEAGAEEEAVRSAPKPRDGDERVQAETADVLSIDFSKLVLSLARQALMMMGEEPDPVSGRAERDVDGARETIDILMLLNRKTHGNLTADESTLLTQMIYELQMKYAQISGK